MQMPGPAKESKQHSNKLQLPFTGLTEEFKVTRAREVLLYRELKDTKVSSARIMVRMGRKWLASCTGRSKTAAWCPGRHCGSGANGSW